MAILAIEEINEGSVASCRSPVAEEIEPGSVVAGVDQRTGIGPPPNGGSKAWIQVLGSFFLFFFNSW
jgi:hypothetical protein